MSEGALALGAGHDELSWSMRRSNVYKLSYGGADQVSYKPKNLTSGRFTGAHNNISISCAVIYEDKCGD